MKPANTRAAVRKLLSLSPERPRLAIVLGSGFNEVVRSLARPHFRIPYAKIPGFPPTGVSGHKGEAMIGRLGGTAVVLLAGRAHYYEGCSMSDATFAVRVLADFGVTDILLTNAAGGIKNSLKPGDFMRITDHINLMGTNPLRGDAPKGVTRFVDLTQAYDRGLGQLLETAAKKTGLKMQSGVYLAVCGPSYETPAEIRAFARLGADAVGMSTVPEVIVARQCGLRVAALSCITNLAAGRSRQPLSHQEVLETGERVQKQAASLLDNFVSLYARSQ